MFKLSESKKTNVASSHFFWFAFSTTGNPLSEVKVLNDSLKK